MECAYCSESIDGDSLYCDMCGNTIILCPTCKVPRKGKACNQCGTLLIIDDANAKGEAVDNTSMQTPPPTSNEAAPSHIHRQPDNNPPIAETIRSAVDDGPPPRLRLVNNTLSLDLAIAPDTVVGRGTGPHMSSFEPHGSVSRTHCRLEYSDELGWTVTDLGSTHGTLCNGQPAATHRAHAIAHNDILKIANIEFRVDLGDS